MGWPTEYAANLIDVTVDCIELLRAGEVGDEEASAVSVALGTLRDIWGAKEFTAREVVKAMTPEPKFDGSYGMPKADDEQRTRAEAIADALGELIGKRLDRPTAHSIGKLFQKRLVGRPAWIDDGKTIATLKKITGHNENSYKIDVSVVGEHQSTAGGVYIPHIPRFPERSGTNPNKAGNEGNGGNVFPADSRVALTDGSSHAPGWKRRL